MTRTYRIPILLIPLLFWACEHFEYSPSEVRVDDEDKYQTEKNIQRFKNQKVGDTLTIAAFGDSQRFHRETAELVQALNKRNDIDLVLHTGDIADFGIQEEFDWMNDKFTELNMPILTVIGNHDLVANGSEVYRQMFGEFDYVVDHERFRFIFLNTNSLEFGFDGTVPNLNWLDQQLADTSMYDQAMVINHVPPFNADFDPNLISEYGEILGRYGKTVLALNGHHHNYNYGILPESNVHFLNTMSAKQKRYIELTITRSGDSWHQIINL